MRDQYFSWIQVVPVLFWGLVFLGYALAWYWPYPKERRPY